MAKATVLPSQDDENTFTINFNSGEHYKVGVGDTLVVLSRVISP